MNKAKLINSPMRDRNWKEASKPDFCHYYRTGGEQVTLRIKEGGSENRISSSAGDGVFAVLTLHPGLPVLVLFQLLSHLRTS